MYNTNTPRNYPLYDLSYGNDFPVEQMFVHYFDIIPSKFGTSKKKYSENIIKHLNSNGFIIISENKFTSNHQEVSSVDSFLLLNKENGMMVTLMSQNIKNKEKCYKLTFYYDVIGSPIEERIDKLNIDQFIIEVKKSDISLVKSEMGHLDTVDYDMNVPDIDLTLNYGEKFMKIHERIVQRLNTQSDNGIILFHGEPGTGKTSYLKYLTRLIEDKEILFIPPTMAESLSEPSIIPFLMEHKNSILIVEDAERVISDRESNGSSAGVSNILNLTDGILGDCLNIQVIATFNMKKEKIDQALLRKGRLIVEHKFEKLSVDETNKLLEHLGKTQRVNEGMCLADIYNIDEESFKTSDNKTQIGFKQ